MNKLLHVVSDAALAPVLEAAGISPGDIRLIDDNLAEGPISSTRTTQDWERLRLQFWQGEGPKGARDARGSGYSEVDDSVSRSPICYWLGPDVTSVLCLAWLSTVYEKRRVSTQQLSVVSMLQHPRTGRALPKVGLLQPGDVIWDRVLSAALQPDEALFLGEIWLAVTSDTPLLLDQLKQRVHPARFPAVEAVRGLKSYYPLVTKGVNTVMLRALEIVGGGARRLSHVLAEYIVRFGDEPTFYGDLALKREFLSLGSTSLVAPLLSVLHSSSSNAEVSITSHGRALLDGKLDHVRVNGIDRWVGGVHLDASRNNLWRYEPETDRFLVETK